jgi:prevent-host-death family protein
MARATDITNFTDYRRHLRKHLSQVRESGRPLFITTNGQTDAVVLSPEAYELAESLAQLERSADDIQAGRTRPAKAALRAVAKKLGLKLER